LALAALAQAALGREPTLAGPPQATLFNDAAIAAFVLDVFLVIAGWPGPVDNKGTAKHAPLGSVGMSANERLTSATSERG
jgi:hypothetical protein